MTPAAGAPRPTSGSAGESGWKNKPGARRVIGYLALIAGFVAFLLPALRPGPDSDVWVAPAGRR